MNIQVQLRFGSLNLNENCLLFELCIHVLDVLIAEVFKSPADYQYHIVLL